MRTRRKGPAASRRNFVTGAAAAATSAFAFPAIAQSRGPLAMRWQSAWPASSIFHEFAHDLAKRIGDMTGGDLRIELLPAADADRPISLLDEVARGAFDAAHGVIALHQDRHHAFALWSCGPAFGMDANMLLAWHKYGGGRELLKKLYAAIGANVVSFAYGPMPTQPLGWFTRPVTRDFIGLRFAAAGAPIDEHAGLGKAVPGLRAAEALSRIRSGDLDGAEFNNATADRRLGFASVSKVCMLQSYHQSAEQFELLFNATRFNVLPATLRAILENAVEAASADLSWKAIDRYSTDYLALQAEGVRFYRTPDAVLAGQLAARDAVAAKRRSDALFREVEESQKVFAERAVRWQLETKIDARAAYNHYFGKS